MTAIEPAGARRCSVGMLFIQWAYYAHWHRDVIFRNTSSVQGVAFKSLN